MVLIYYIIAVWFGYRRPIFSKIVFHSVSYMSRYALCITIQRFPKKFFFFFLVHASLKSKNNKKISGFSKILKIENRNRLNTYRRFEIIPYRQEKRCFIIILRLTENIIS